VSTFSGFGAYVTSGKVDIPAGYGETGGMEAGSGTWLPGMRWESWGDSGPASKDQAMCLSAVFACLRLLSEAISTLPLDVYRRVGGTREEVPRPRYMTFNPPGLSQISYLSQLMLSVLTDGNAFVATPRDELGSPTSLVPLDPTLVEVKRGPGNVPYYLVKDEVYSWFDIMHIPGMMLPGELRGVSPLRAAREVIESGRKAQEFGSKFMGNMAVPPAVISVPDSPGTESARDRAKNIGKVWNETHGGASNAGKVGVLMGGATLTTVAISPEDAQWLDSKRFGVSEIARFYGVPPHLIADASNSTSWGSGLAEQNLAFGQFSVTPWTSRLEEGHGRLLYSDGLTDVQVKLNMDAKYRASLKDRYESYAVGIDKRFLKEEEARALEDLPPLDPRIDPADAEAVGALVRAGYKPDAVLEALGLPPIEHTGRVPVTVQAKESP